MSKLIREIVKVPLSKLHFELYDHKSGDKIYMGDEIKINKCMFRAWTDDIHHYAVRSVEFPKFSYTEPFTKEEPMATLHLCYEEGVDYTELEKSFNIINDRTSY